MGMVALLLGLIDLVGQPADFLQKIANFWVDLAPALIGNQLGNQLAGRLAQLGAALFIDMGKNPCLQQLLNGFALRQLVNRLSIVAAHHQVGVLAQQFEAFHPLAERLALILQLAHDSSSSCCAGGSSSMRMRSSSWIKRASSSR